MSRRGLIAKIHIAKKELALDDGTYRQALHRVTGKASCSTMSDTELDSVLSHFKHHGWKPKNNHRRYSPNTRHHIHHDHVDKIRALWIDMVKRGVIDNGTEAALDAWVKRTTLRLNKGVGIDRVEWLRSKRDTLATHVLESLKQWQKRVFNQWQNDDYRLIHLEQKRTDQAQVIVVRQLLDAHVISWWPLFANLGIENSSTFCQNRRNLHRG